MNTQNLYDEMINSVPAYASFLKGSNVISKAVFEELPLMNKQNYLLKFPTKMLCRGGTIDGCHLIGASSGFSKSGSVFWPKRPIDERDYVKSIETMFIDYYGIDRKKTLIFVCLAFGTWIGGMQIASAVRTLASSGIHPITVATPGLNIKESIDIYESFSEEFDQFMWITNPSNVNIISYLLDKRKLDYKNGNIYFPVVGEYFSENMREKIAADFGHEKSSEFCLWTGYGSADTGDLGAETTTTIRLRKFFNENPQLCEEIFKLKSPPMLLEMTSKSFIEIIDGRIVVTKDQMIPLMRYDTGDSGGIIEKKDIKNFLQDSLYKELPDRILFVNGRASDAIIFYGTNLMVNSINDFLLKLEEDMAYGGYFEIEEINSDSFASYKIVISIKGKPEELLRKKYQNMVIEFLKKQSREFSLKYSALSNSIGDDLIKVELKEIETDDVKLKHKFIRR